VSSVTSEPTRNLLAIEIDKKMTILLEDTEEVCSHCVQLRKTFILIAVSAVLPILVFAALLLLVATGKLETEFETATSVIVEFVFGLLYVQLFVATSVLITSFVKRKQPVLKYQLWYIVFHAVVILFLIFACTIMTAINEAYFLTGIVVIGGFSYFYFLYITSLRINVRGYP
jgi:hypothetical protein